MSDAESRRRERILRSLTFLAALTAAALTAYLGWRISHPSTVAEVDIDVEFEEALLLGETREVRRILESGFRPEDSRYNDVPVAIRAIVSRHHQMLPLLGRERLNERDATGTPALLYAAAFGLDEALKTLLDLGAERDSRNEYGLSALHCAARGGNLRTIHRLLDAGYSADDRDIAGFMPADQAIANNRCHAAQLLLTRESHPRPELQRTCDLAPIQPRICTGAQPGLRIGALIDDKNILQCPPNHGIYSIDDPPISLHSFTLGGICCPLPSSDIIAPQLVRRRLKCPDGTIIAGAFRYPKTPLSQMQVYCVVIDNNRYVLGPELHGVGWGLGNDWQKARFRTDEIPSAIRFSVGRTSPTSWDIDGCIADPIGALATGVANPTCETATFRQLQYAGLPGDPPAGTPVQMFPDCAIPPDMWSTDATCEGSMRYHLSDAERVQDAW